MQPAAGGDAAQLVDHALPRPRFSATLSVVVIRMVSVVALTIIYVGSWTSETSPAPDTFSLGSWCWMLLPPTILLASLLLGFRLRVPHSLRWQRYLSQASAAITALALVLASTFSVFYLFGQLFDWAIG